MADMQVAIGLRWKAGADLRSVLRRTRVHPCRAGVAAPGAPGISVAGDIAVDDGAKEVAGWNVGGHEGAKGRDSADFTARVGCVGFWDRGKAFPNLLVRRQRRRDARRVYPNRRPRESVGPDIGFLDHLAPGGDLFADMAIKHVRGATDYFNS